MPKLLKAGQKRRRQNRLHETDDLNILKLFRDSFGVPEKFNSLDDETRLKKTLELVKDLLKNVEDR